MKSDKINNFLICIDSNAHYIPVLGTVVALGGIFERCILLSFFKQENFHENRYFSHICNKSFDAFILEACPVLGSIIIYLATATQKPNDLLMNCPGLLQRTPVLHKDKDFILKSIGNFSTRALKYADPTLLKDKELMLKVLNVNWGAIGYVDPALLKDKEFMLDVLKISWLKNEKDMYDDPIFLKTAVFILKFSRSNLLIPTLLKDKEFVLKALEIDWGIVKYADPTLLKDKEFMLNALNVNWGVVKYADPTLLKDKELMLNALNVNWGAIRYVDPTLLKDKELMLNALNVNWGAIRYVDPTLLKDKELMLNALNVNWGVVKYADPTLLKDKEFVLKALNVNWEAIRYVNPVLKEDWNFALEAAKINPLTLKYISKSLTLENLFMSCVLQQRPLAETSSGDMTITSKINLNKLYLAPPLISLPKDDVEANITNLMTELGKITKDDDLLYGMYKICDSIKYRQKEPSVKQLSCFLKSIINQWQKGKGLEYKDKNLKALADAGNKCFPTWLEIAEKIYSELDDSGTPEAKLLLQVQEYKEETVLQWEQYSSQWHALNIVKAKYGKELGLNTSRVQHDIYMNSAKSHSTKQDIMVLWDAHSLLESVYNALCTQEYDVSFYDFLTQITKKNYTKGIIADFNIEEYVADNFYTDYKLNRHAVHVMLIETGVLKKTSN